MSDTSGLFSPTQVFRRVGSGTWVSPEELGGMVLLAPSSIAYTGTSASIGANGSVEFTAVSSLSLNGVFSADYDNYMVAYGGNANGDYNIALRFRQSGTDNPSATQILQELLSNATTVSASRSSAQTNTTFMATSSTNRSVGVGYIYGPYLSQPTAYRSTVGSGENSARTMDFAATESSSTQWDGFSLYPSGGNISGLVSVYGLVGA